MRTACAALLLVAALAVPARAGCGPDRADGEARADLKDLAAKLEQVRGALAAEKEELARADDACRKRLKALEQELAELRAYREKLLAGKVDRVRRLAEVQAELEARLAKRMRLAEKPPPAAKGHSAEDKLDLILKKLDDLERRLRKLEGKP
jgi:hypothetical protein